jgi:hypothetical protein
VALSAVEGKTMPTPTDRLKQTMLRVAAVFQAIGVLGLAIAAGHTWIAKFFTDHAVARQLADFLGWSIPLITAVALFSVLWRASFIRSRVADPDRFELRPRKRSDLKGREQDIRDLLALLAEYPLLFVIGESGSGKSTLFENGLILDVREQARLVPILIRRYGSSWDGGPLKELLAATWASLGEDDSKKAGLSDRPEEDDSVGALRNALEQISKRLGRQPLLIFDQFDDHLLAHRASFTTDRGSWKGEDIVRKDNPFWATISELLKGGFIRCIFVTRSDASSGLECVRFLPPTEIAARDVLRLKPEYLLPLLDELAPADAQPPIVSEPERGWAQLKAILNSELQRSGAVLPQQVRTVALGLRTLRWLTIREYRRNGGAVGMEALYIGRAITDCAQRARVPVSSIRALLSMLVSASDNEADLKTIALAPSSFSALFAETDRLSPVLRDLAQSEIVRPVWNAEKAVEEWQLDHDYLARAVRLETRLSGKTEALLRESATVWRSAVELRMRWRSLLPLRNQLSLVRERLRRGGAFRYGGDAGFAIASLARFLPIVALLAIGAIFSWWTNLDSRMQALFDADGRQTTMQMWDASPLLRMKLSNELMKNPRKRTNLGEVWPLPILGLDRERLRDAVISTLGAKQFDFTDLQLIRDVSPLLGRPTADLTAKAVLEHARGFPDELTVDALSAVQFAMSEERSRAVEETALSRLRELMKKIPTEPSTLLSRVSPACKNLDSIFLHSSSKTISAAITFIEPHIKDEDLLLIATQCVQLYEHLLASLEPSVGARQASTNVLINYVNHITSEAFQPGTVNSDYFIPPLTGLAKIDAGSADEIAGRIYRSSLEQFRKQCFRRESDCADSNSKVKFTVLTGRIFQLSGAFSAKTASATLHDVVPIYWDLIDRNATEQNDAFDMLHVIGALTPQLDTDGANELLRILRSAADGTELPSILQSGTIVNVMLQQTSSNALFETLSALVPHLPQSSADRLIDDLREVSMGETGQSREYYYLDTLGVMAPYLSPPVAIDLAHRLEIALSKSSEHMVRAHQLRALGHAVYALPSTEISARSKSLIENLFGPDGTDEDSASATAEAAGRACEAMVRAGLNRTVGIECMLLAVAAPKSPSYIQSPNPYSWKEIAAFAQLPEAALPSDVLTWAEMTEGIDLAHIRPSTVRAHFRSVK